MELMRVECEMREQTSKEMIVNDLVGERKEQMSNERVVGLGELRREQMRKGRVGLVARKERMRRGRGLVAARKEQMMIGLEEG